MCRCRRGLGPRGRRKSFEIVCGRVVLHLAAPVLVLELAPLDACERLSGGYGEVAGSEEMLTVV